MKKTMLVYTQNGDIFYGECQNTTSNIKGTIAMFKQKGYTQYYQGIRATTGQKVLVAINDNNKVSLEQRRSNGLSYAKEKFIY